MKDDTIISLCFTAFALIKKKIHENKILDFFSEFIALKQIENYVQFEKNDKYSKKNTDHEISKTFEYSIANTG